MSFMIEITREELEELCRTKLKDVQSDMNYAIGRIDCLEHNEAVLTINRALATLDRTKLLLTRAYEELKAQDPDGRG